ncbi:MAG: RNA-binding transcriptional accessory protein [Pseudomonadales bacterium]|nr:RNA-binding transcriptional accessory protein [Pseudomonadales bacterium]
MDIVEQNIIRQIAKELSVKNEQVAAAVQLLGEGATVPFIARYRKEVTGALDDTQLRTLEERLLYLRELEDRRKTVLTSIAEQGKLTPDLEKDILAADTKNRLEDLYLPYKPKRRTKAQIAREAGIEPLAQALLDNPLLIPQVEAEAFINAEQGFADAQAVLDGAKQILMERFSEDAKLVGELREYLLEHGLVKSQVLDGKQNEGEKFRDYFDFSEKVAVMPSHRALAIFRGRKEGVLAVTLALPEELTTPEHMCERRIALHAGIRKEGRAADAWLAEVVRWTWRIKLLTHLETDLFGQLRDKAEEEAIRVFASNLKDLLLAAPAGQKVTLGLDPGLRTGVKVALVDGTGKVLQHGAIFPHPPQQKTAEAEKILLALCKQYDVNLISIGNGTASRETEKFVADILKKHSEIKAKNVVVSEAGASVYSASELAAKEFPDLDVTIRGAVSIARRLQDPLAELVKIEPKSIGVGQYQHDVNQMQLARSLDAVVEDCVNSVGVDVNTASVALLRRVSGLNQTIAANIVEFRDKNGAFRSRDALRAVPRLGDKTFEQAAGFLRINDGDNPLDKSAVHPESYVVVERIANKTGRSIDSLIGDSVFLRGLQARDFVCEQFGLPTVQDIIRELDKPGRDPRPEFKTATFREGVEKISDLQLGMVLEGVVTNVANFGAFVDIGVHQDGLVHISAITNRFIKDPREAVKTGDIVKVKVLEVDVARKRIALSMRLDDAPGPRAESKSNAPRADRKSGYLSSSAKPAAAPANGSMGDLLRKAMEQKQGR